MSFEWDAQNIDHVALHGVSVETIEAVFDASDASFAKVDAVRFLVHGTVNGRHYRVVAALVGEETVRVITAHRISKKRTK